jgi:hypothetical protein
MNQRVVIPLLVAASFGVGFGARVVTERDTTLPLPPPVGSEFARAGCVIGADTKTDAKPANSRVIDRATLIADIERNWAQIETYQKRMAAIETDFDRDLIPILDQEQLRHKEELKKGKADSYAAKMKTQSRDERARALMTDAEIESTQQFYLLRALDTVAITPRLNYLNRVYKLTAEQQAAAHVILEARREKFLRLIDEIPPPSIRLVALASRMQQLVEPHPAEPQAAPAAPAK